MSTPGSTQPAGATSSTARIKQDDSWRKKNAIDEEKPTTTIHQQPAHATLSSPSSTSSSTTSSSNFALTPSRRRSNSVNPISVMPPPTLVQIPLNNESDIRIIDGTNGITNGGGGSGASSAVGTPQPPSDGNLTLTSMVTPSSAISASTPSTSTVSALSSPAYFMLGSPEPVEVTSESLGKNAKISSVTGEASTPVNTMASPTSSARQQQQQMNAPPRMPTPSSASSPNQSSSTSSSSSRTPAVASLPDRVLEFVCLYSYDASPFVRSGHTEGTPSGLDFINGDGLKGELKYRLPSSKERPKGEDLPEALEHFVYPSGLRLEVTPTPPLLHSFVLTQLSGARMYAYVYTKWHVVPDHVLTIVKLQIGESLIDCDDPQPHLLPSTLYGPHSLVFISSYPFYDALTTMLKYVAERFFMVNLPTPIVSSSSSSSAAALAAKPAAHPSMPSNIQLIDAIFSAFRDVSPSRVPFSHIEQRLSCTHPHFYEFRDAVTAMCAYQYHPQQQSQHQQGIQSSAFRRQQAGSTSASAGSSGSSSNHNDYHNGDDADLDGEDGEGNSTPFLLETSLGAFDPQERSQQIHEALQICLRNSPFYLPSAPFDNLPYMEASILGILFESLSISHIISVWNALLCELPCLFVSDSVEKLTPALESLSALLYPMKWPYVYIPVLPIFLTDVLDAPQPFLIGASKDVLEVLPESLLNGDNNIVIIDLDTDSLCISGNYLATQRRLHKARIAERTNAAILATGGKPLKYTDDPADRNPFVDPFCMDMKFLQLLLANQGLAPSLDEVVGEKQVSQQNSISLLERVYASAPITFLGTNSLDSISTSNSQLSLSDLNPFKLGSSSATGGATYHQCSIDTPSSLALGDEQSQLVGGGSDFGHQHDTLLTPGSESGGNTNYNNSANGMPTSALRHKHLPWNLSWRLYDGLSSIVNPLVAQQRDMEREERELNGAGRGSSDGEPSYGSQNGGGGAWNDKPISRQSFARTTPRGGTMSGPAGGAGLSHTPKSRRSRQNSWSRMPNNMSASNLLSPSRNIATRTTRASSSSTAYELSTHIGGLDLLSSLPPNLPTHAWPVLLPGLVKEWRAAAVKYRKNVDLDAMDPMLGNSLSYLGNEANFLSRFQQLLEHTKRPVLLLSTTRFLYSGSDGSASESELEEEEHESCNQSQSGGGSGNGGNQSMISTDISTTSSNTRQAMNSASSHSLTTPHSLDHHQQQASLKSPSSAISSTTVTPSRRSLILVAPGSGSSDIINHEGISHTLQQHSEGLLLPADTTTRRRSSAVSVADADEASIAALANTRYRRSSAGFAIMNSATQNSTETPPPLLHMASNPVSHHSPPSNSNSPPPPPPPSSSSSSLADNLALGHSHAPLPHGHMPDLNRAATTQVPQHTSTSSAASGEPLTIVSATSSEDESDPGGSQSGSRSHALGVFDRAPSHHRMSLPAMESTAKETTVAASPFRQRQASLSKLTAASASPTPLDLGPLNLTSSSSAKSPAKALRSPRGSTKAPQTSQTLISPSSAASAGTPGARSPASPGAGLPMPIPRSTPSGRTHSGKSDTIASSVPDDEAFDMVGEMDVEFDFNQTRTRDRASTCSEEFGGRERASVTVSPPPLLPLRELSTAAPQSIWSTLTQEELISVRRRFLSTLVSLLHSHRAFTGFTRKDIPSAGAVTGSTPSDDDAESYEVTFEVSSYLRYIHRDYRPFLSLFLETQMMKFFTEERLTRESSSAQNTNSGATTNNQQQQHQQSQPQSQTHSQPSSYPSGTLSKSGSQNTLSRLTSNDSNLSTNSALFSPSLASSQHTHDTLLPGSISTPTHSAGMTPMNASSSSLSLVSSQSGLASFPSPVVQSGNTSATPNNNSPPNNPSPSISNDWFDRLCSQKRTRTRLLMNVWGENGLSGILYKLGRKVPTWKERYFELNRHGTILRYYSYSPKMIELEPQFKELKRRYKLSPRDVVTKANLDRIAEQREKLRTSLFRGEITIIPGQTNVFIPNQSRKYMTCYCFEVVTPTRSLLACAPDLKTRDEWILCIRARAAKLSIDHKRMNGGVGGSSLLTSLNGIGSTPHLESRLQMQLRLLREKNIASLTKSFMENLQKKQQKFIAGELEGGSSGDLAQKRTSMIQKMNLGGGGLLGMNSSAGSASGGSTPAGGATPGISSEITPLSLPHALLVCEHLRTSLDLRKYSSFLRGSHLHCFSGRDATTYILHQNLCDSLADSIVLCNLMLTSGLILNVNHSASEQFHNDAKYMYTFPKHSLLHGAGVSVGSGTNGANGEGDAGTNASNLLPTEEERVILARMREELDVRDRVHGLFRNLVKDCFVARDAIVWLLDRGICSNESAAIRLATRLVRTLQILPVHMSFHDISTGHTSAHLNHEFSNSGDLYKFHPAIKPNATNFTNEKTVRTPRK